MEKKKLLLESVFAVVCLTVCLSSGAKESVAYRPPAVPLVTVDPYMSVWSFSDHLYDSWPVHWTGQVHAMAGIIRVDGNVCRFMGPKAICPNAVKQTSVCVKPTRTFYTFEAGGIELRVIFITPMLPSDLSLLTSPVTFITFQTKALDKRPHTAAVYFDVSGEWVVVMDCDLQDQPEEIFRLYEKAKEGYDMVVGSRVRRKDNAVKRSFSKLFHRLLSYLTSTKQDSAISNFGIYHAKVIQAVNAMKDYVRCFPPMVQWVGFKQTTIDVAHTDRKMGKTSYTFKKLVNLSMNVIVGFSNKPLRLTVKLGLFISFLAFVFAIYTFIRYLSGGIDISGWTSLILSIWFLSGIIIFLIGMVGLYIGKVFENVKDRPKYIINQTLNFPDNPPPD